MKYSLKDLKSCKIITTDDADGKVKDILFDENTWIIRYIEADFGMTFASRRLLIPRGLLKEVNLKDKAINISLTSDELKNCPKPEDDKPISRIFEEQLNRHYGTDIYWQNPDYNTYGGTSFGPYYNTPRIIGTTPPIVADDPENKMKTSLQNFNEVEGYSIHVSDGKLGHVEDFIVDDNIWQITFLIIDTSSWPWGKKVILPVNQVETIDFGFREARLNLNSETVKNAPEYDSSKLYQDDYGLTLNDYYEKSYVK